MIQKDLTAISLLHLQRCINTYDVAYSSTPASELHIKVTRFANTNVCLIQTRQVQQRKLRSETCANIYKPFHPEGTHISPRSEI